jgi:gliding motility-associated protein GldM
MAGAKLSPRQKMINLMYLVFIAMLALNMSKEVLSAFGTINESLEESITTFNVKNDAALNALSVKADEAKDQFGKVYEDAKKVNQATTKLYNYLEDVKQKMNSSVDDPKDYEIMDKSSFVNEMFFIVWL